MKETSSYTQMRQEYRIILASSLRVHPLNSQEPRRNVLLWYKSCQQGFYQLCQLHKFWEEHGIRGHNFLRFYASLEEMRGLPC